MKHYYFLQALKNNEVPDVLAELWAEAKDSNNKKVQTKLINGVMTSKGKGKGFAVDIQSPVFKEMVTKVEKRFFRLTDVGIPRCVMAGKLGGMEKLDAALESGEVKEVVAEDGNKYYAFRELRVGKQVGAEMSRTVSTNKNINKGLADKVSGMIESLNWSFKFSAAQEKAK